MKKKKEPKFRWGLYIITCLLLSLFKGCGDTQSNQVVYVNGYSVTLLHNPDEPDGERPDRWAVSNDAEGKDICGVAHGFFLQLTDESSEAYHEAGIRVDVEVINHGSVGGFGDIWEEEAPNGEQYGFVKVIPEEGSGVYNGVVHGRTDGQGRLWIFCGLGDPEGTFDPDPGAPLDYGYELPGPGSSYPDVFDTFVQLKITIPRRHSPLDTFYVWATFLRMQLQNFWAPLGGVYGNSSSGIGQFGGSMLMLSEDNNSVEHSVSQSTLPLGEAKTPKDESANYPLVTLGKEGSTMDYVISSDGVSLDSLDLTQLRWAYVEPWGWDWYYFLVQYGEDLHAMWIGEPNDSNAVTEALGVSEPYAFWADVTLPSPFYGDNATTTVHLRALDDFNDVKSKIPLTMHLSDKTPDNMTLTFLSEWFVISEDPNFHGHYQDGWGNCYTVIYMPVGTHPDVNFPEVFGDFNADDKVDFYDFALLANHWQDSIYDPNTDYDAMYEEPNDWDGEIRMPELGVFADNWLWEEGGAMRGSGMDSGSSLDSGLTEELYTAALPEQLEPQPQPEPEPELQPQPEPEPELQPEPEPQPQLTEEDIEELAKWLEELWLTDEQVRQQFSEAEWLEFIETVRETPIY